MQLRVCGAERELPPWQRRQCWCGGVFCGPGGMRLTEKFRRETRTKVVARSMAQYRELLAQLDLFAGEDVAARWHRAVPDKPQPLRVVARQGQG